MSAPRPPLIVVRGGPDSHAAACAEARAAGWTVVDGLGERAGPPVVRAVVLGDADDATLALLLAVHGDGLVVSLEAGAEVGDAFLDDLERVGPVDHRTPGRDPGCGLNAEHRTLLAHLAAGRSLGEAARLMFLSRRTADRRLAEARLALGAETTAEAIRALGAADAAGRS